MSDEWWGLGPAVSGTLQARGWAMADELVRQVVPAVARHGNAVIAVPPTPSRAAPALTGVAAAVAASRGRALILAAPALVAPLGRELARLAAGTELRIVTALGPARASRRLASGTVDLLVTSPATALALHTRSALRIDGFTSITLAWPEEWHAEEALTVLLADLAKDAQRVVLTGEPRAIVELVERHVRRSLTVGFADLGTDPAMAPANSIRTFPVSWASRAAGLVGLVELLDPERVAVWTADRADHDELLTALAEIPAGSLVAGGVPDAPVVICHDLPTPGELAALGSGRDVVLLVPPGTEGYVARIAPSHRPIREAGMVDLTRDRDATLRAEIVAQMEGRELTAAAYAIAPLFERYDAQAIAAACFALWRRSGGSASAMIRAAEEPAEAPTPVGGVANSKIWVGVGRRDDATPGDLVAVLVKEVGLPREAVGRIELRETFSLVEVPVDQAERVAQGLTGLTIRRRKLVARVDRGMPARSGGPPARSGGGRPPRR